MSESNVAIITTPKDPRTEEDFNWDVAPLLKVGDTVAAIDRTFVERGDSALVIVSPPAVNVAGNAMSARLGGGRRGVRYRVTIFFTTATGEKLDFSIEFDCT
jgi:hypothetical protein